TGNASGNVGVGKQTYRSRGERFGIEHPDRNWYEKANAYQKMVGGPGTEYVETRPAKFPRAQEIPTFDLEPVPDEEQVEPIKVPNEHGFDLEVPIENLPPEERKLLGTLQRHRREAAKQGLYPKAGTVPQTPSLGPPAEVPGVPTTEYGLEPGPEAAPNWLERNFKLPTFDEGPGASWWERNFKPHLATEQEMRARSAVISPEVVEKFPTAGDVPEIQVSPDFAAAAFRYSQPLATAVLDGLSFAFPEKVAAAREGWSRSAAKTMSAMTTPKNSLLLGTAVLMPYVGVPAFVARGVSLGFSLAAIHGAIDEAKHVKGPVGSPEWWEGVTNVATNTLFAGVTAVHGAGALKDVAAINRAAAAARVTPAVPQPIPQPAPAVPKPTVGGVAKTAVEAAAEGPAVPPQEPTAPGILPVPIRPPVVTATVPRPRVPIETETSTSRATADAEGRSFPSPEHKAARTKNSST